MRQICTVQSSIFDLFADHEIERELHQMSKWLDQHFELAESVLRCALLKQYQQLSYTELSLFSRLLNPPYTGSKKLVIKTKLHGIGLIIKVEFAHKLTNPIKILPTCMPDPLKTRRFQ